MELWTPLTPPHEYLWCETTKEHRSHIVFPRTFFPWGPFSAGHFNVSFAYLVAHFKPINFLLKKKQQKPSLFVCTYTPLTKIHRKLL